MKSRIAFRKKYWGIRMAKYVEAATEWSEKKFVNTVYKDYRFEYILGSAFLSVTEEGEKNWSENLVWI